MRFAVPMLWAPPEEHNDDSCYFCAFDVFGHSAKTKEHIKYSTTTSSTRPSEHDDQHPIPIPIPVASVVESENIEMGEAAGIAPSTTQGNSYDPTFQLTTDSSCKHLPFDSESLDYFVRILGLTQTKSEIAASLLNERNLLDEGVKITSFRTRSKHLQRLFTMEDNVIFCNNVVELFVELKFEYKPDEWRLFIDSSKESLKAALINKGKRLPTIPIAYSTKLKES